eukprot:g1687.t1
MAEGEGDGFFVVQEGMNAGDLIQGKDSEGKPFQFQLPENLQPGETIRIRKQANDKGKNKEKEKKKWAPRIRAVTLSRFLSPYFLLNMTCILSYLGIRLTRDCPQLTASADSWFGLSKEVTILGMGTVAIASKYRSSPTVDHFAGHVLLYAKTCVLVLLWYVDSRICMWYAVVIFTLFLVLRTPKYNFMPLMSATEFKENVLAKGSGQWLIECSASWHSGSISYEPMFAELHQRYGCADLQFARIDVDQHKSIAEHLGINTSSYSSLQLPSYILFQEGKEQKRLPPLNSRKEPVKTFIDRRGISAYFALDKIFLKAKRSSSSK